ncbi:efflux transporter outer membrane subunit [Burkholderia pseudomallei]|uniref:efflux transporter outer membrane subunit n=1 Tax=Burkholderia pseudomallei TaxID=28450 RepID=UPI0010645662|nr:efflux transporter outer membrane subunit [Burkholderia pseudomallei]QBP65107.1 efflux transporter outer membrane subunit [Burkholderia pseudomallei]
MRRALTRWRLSFALAALAALASACTVGPDFHPPRADVPAQWHDVTATSTSSASSASSAASPPAARSGAPNAGAPPRSLPTVEADPDPRWWRTFGDPVLDRLVERAAQDNLDVQAAVLRIAEARAQVRAAAAQGLPDVRASASYQREQLGLKGFLEDGGVDAQLERLGAPGSPLERIAPGAGAALRRGAEHTLDQLTSPVNLWQAGFDASWELDLFGRVRRSVEAAGAQTQAAIEGRNDALLSLEAEVAQTYLQLRGAQALRALAVALADGQRDVVALTRDQARKGLSSELDVQSADARLAQLRAQLPQFDQQIALLRNGLSYLLGDAPGALDDALREPRALPELPPTVPIGLPSTLARRRPDIRRAEAQLHAATAGVGVAVAQFYPDVSLTGQVGTRATHARELAHWSHLFYAFGPSVSLPIFEGGALVANLRLSQAQQAQAALGYRRAVLLALRDVDNALAAYRTDQTRRDALRDAAAAERTTFELARDSYRHGLVSFIDVLDAERELSQARQQYVQGSLQLTTDLVSLYKALGGGWQPVPAAQTPAPAALDAPTQDTPLGATAPARR